MSVLAKVGHQAIATATGLDTLLVGTPFSAGEPIKVPILLPTRQTALGWSGNESIFMGLGSGVSSTQRASAMGVSRGNVGTTESHRYLANNRIYGVPNHNANTVDAEADLNSLGANTVLDWIDASPAARILMHAALGGSSITDVAVISFTETSSSPQNVTDPAIDFDPLLVLLYWNGANTDGALNSKEALFLGAFNAAGEQFAFDCTALTGTKLRWLRDDRCMMVKGDAVTISAHFGQMLSPGEVAADGGFQLVYDNTPAPTDLQGVKAIVFGGTFSSKIGVKAKATGAAPAVDMIPLGFKGAFSLLATVSAADAVGGGALDTGEVSHNRGSVGFFDGNNMRAYGWTDEDGASPSSCFAYLTDAAGLVIANNNTATIDALGAPSYQGDDLKMTWSPNDANAPLWAHMTIGPPPSSSPAASVARRSRAFRMGP